MRIYGFWQPRNLLTTPFGPFVNKNHFAGWMLMAMPLAAGYVAGLAERGHARRARHDGAIACSGCRPATAAACSWSAFALAAHGRVADADAVAIRAWRRFVVAMLVFAIVAARRSARP